MRELSLKEKLIIEEETDNLQKLRNMSLAFSPAPKNHSRAYRREILSLNKAASQNNIEDRAQISVHINRLEALIERQYQPTSDIELKNPYFAHIKLREEKKIRNLYIGNQVFYIPNAEFQIIDWKTSPISIIYFLYEEGDQYDEEIENQWFEGTVEFKRQLKILNGEVVGIKQRDMVLSKDKKGWFKTQSQSPLLLSEMETSDKAKNISCGPLGSETQKARTLSKSATLSGITSFMNSEQYKIITDSPDGVVAIQGVAGSGKTTAGLYRIAWLNSQHSRRFPEESIMVMVFNKSLGNYISKSLSSLGLNKIKTVCLEDWFSQQRQRLFGGRLPQQHSSQTPMSAVIFKKHPALLKIINEFINKKETSFNRELNNILNSQKKIHFPDRLKSLPLISRLYALRKWLSEKTLSSKEHLPGPELKSLLRRLISNYINPEKSKIETLTQYWEELFSNFEYLKKKFQTLADDISGPVLEEAIDWLKKQYIQKHSPLSSQPDVFEEVSSHSQSYKKRNKKIFLDYEDNPILLYFYQKLLKAVSHKNKKLKYSHLMIDEAQDLSLIELAALLDIVRKPRSLTLAGDINQKLLESSRHNWDMIFNDLYVKKQKISTLKVGYRSTRQIMEFAFSILENSDEREFIAKRHGPPVKLTRFYSQGESTYFLSQILKKLATKKPYATIALICLTPSEAEENYGLLKKMEIPRLRLVADQDFSFEPGVDISDIKQVKGLEFDYVILLNVDNINYPPDKHSKHLLHIASTRAAHQLWLLNHRPPSPLLPKWLVNNQESSF